MRAMTDFVTIVSGLPRSGTSLMMQMLQAGGLPVLTDAVRATDEDNPRGYLEFEPVKHTRDDPSWLDGAAGKAVKMVHLLLQTLPSDRSTSSQISVPGVSEIITPSTSRSACDSSWVSKCAQHGCTSMRGASTIRS